MLKASRPSRSIHEGSPTNYRPCGARWARGLKNAATMELRGFWGHFVDPLFFVQPERLSQTAKTVFGTHTLSSRLLTAQKCKNLCGSGRKRRCARRTLRGLLRVQILTLKRCRFSPLKGAKAPMGFSHSSVGKAICDLCFVHIANGLQLDGS